MQFHMRKAFDVVLLNLTVLKNIPNMPNHWVGGMALGVLTLITNLQHRRLFAFLPRSASCLEAFPGSLLTPDQPSILASANVSGCNSHIRSAMLLAR